MPQLWINKIAIGLKWLTKISHLSYFMDSHTDICLTLPITKIFHLQPSSISRKELQTLSWFSRVVGISRKKEALEKLVELGKRSETGENVTKSLLEFQNNYGFTCLTILFSGPGEYVSETEKLPPQLMLRGIEECCEYLIDLAKFYNLDLKKILNQTTKAGLTVFHLASKLSEKLTRRLIEENVQVNSINNYFVTPYFRVSN